ncbi:threonine ammonia-lyase [Pseudophaeobacter flagellatus]|uniref:threonine ammonia-lyase n=1 Tax=Pseudophaeobacter flagellatus TaxID=2899119 RepID=UPI001E2886A8|nr:threonine/serine dehydratase [Pseudophaeobacter flagellatus]MCD9149173.1 threonine/serine dehydratase [Pseudophaeobacter flagellatus]
MSSFAMIQSAAKRLQGHARVTPMLSSPFLDEIAGRRVLVKAECLQHTGSFKFRGGWAAITALTAEARAGGVIAYSSGNHAQGVAAAAKAHGVAAVILMPADAPRLKIENTRALGAEVVLYDRAGGEDRDAIGLELAQTRGLTLIKPYDEPEVIAGQGTAGLEIADQAANLGVETGDVLVCCGGGGLTSGVALALEGLGSSLRVRPAEPEGFDDVTRSLASGQVETNAAVSGSICDAILTPAPGELTFPLLQRLCGGGIVVSEEEALRAMALAFMRLKIVLEPGGAVSLAAALFHPDQIQGDAVIAIATGGNVDTAVFQRALSSYA